MLGLFRECNQVKAESVLSGVKCPVKALWREHDIIYPYDDAKDVLMRFSADCTVIPNSGHSPMNQRIYLLTEPISACKAR
ncbi:alpha/beta fold hydrolase [Eionea flava]